MMASSDVTEDQVVPGCSGGAMCAPEEVGQSALPPTGFISAAKKLHLCDYKCQDQRVCRKLHICPHFLYSGTCFFTRDAAECRFGHDLKSGHNREVLQGLGLDDLPEGELRDRLQLVQHNYESVRVCSIYNDRLPGKRRNSTVRSDHSEDGQDCAALHICHEFLYQGHELDECAFSHDFMANNCMAILKLYNIDVEELTTTVILKDFQAMKTTPTQIDSKLPRFFLDYHNIEKIGSGGYGEVFKVQHILDKQWYAVKRVSLDHEYIDVDKAKREVVILATLKHENIVRYYSSWMEDLPRGQQRLLDQHFISGSSSSTSGSRSQSTSGSSSSTSGSRSPSTSGSSSSTSGSNSSSTSGSPQKYSTKTPESSSSWGIDFRSNGTSDAHKLEDMNVQSVVGAGGDADQKAPTASDDLNANWSTTSSVSGNLDVPDLACPPVSADQTHGSSQEEYDPENVAATERYLYIVTELCSHDPFQENCGSLADHLIGDMRQQLQMDKIFMQIVQALVCIHESGLIHRDLKPDNVFLSTSECSTIRLGDFGLARYTRDEASDSRPYSTEQGTDTYKSPEMLQKKDYNEATDIYSLGVMAVEIFFPMKTCRERVEVLKEARKQAQPPQDLRPLSMNLLIKRMLSVDPKNRPTASEISTQL